MIEVREAKEADEKEVYDLALKFLSSIKIDENSFSETWKEKIVDKNSFTCIAELKGKVIAYAAGYKHRSFYANGATFWVDEIMVEEAFRKNGIGTKLMNNIEMWAKENGCKQVLLASSKMERFYNRLGFKNTAGYFKKYL